MNLLLSDAAVMSGGALKAMRVPKFVSAKTVTSPSPTIGRVVSCAVLFGVPKKMTSSVQRINELFKSVEHKKTVMKLEMETRVGHNFFFFFAP